MTLFAILAIVMGVFLLGSFIALFVSEKNNRGKIKYELISYLVASILTITFGILLLFKFTSWWRLFCTGALIIILTVFLIITIMLDKKGKKYIKYKSTGHGKNRHITQVNDKYEDIIDTNDKNNENN